MQIRWVMTSYCLQLKSGKYLISDISGNIEAVILKLGTTNVHLKRNKMTPLVLLPWEQFCRWCCVNKNRNSRFCFKARTIYPTQSNDGTKDNMGTISVLSRTLCPTVEVAMGWQKETGAKRVAMETALRVSFCFFFDAHLWCQVSRSLLQYFQIYRLLRICHFVAANNIASSFI